MCTVRCLEQRFATAAPVGHHERCVYTALPVWRGCQQFLAKLPTETGENWRKMEPMLKLQTIVWKRPEPILRPLGSRLDSVPDSSSVVVP